MPKTVRLPFPVHGVNVTTSHADQPTTTTPSAVNVRLFDQFEDRARGGQREGDTKYLRDPINTNVYVDGSAYDHTGGADGERSVTFTNGFVGYTFRDGDYIIVPTGGSSNTSNVAENVKLFVASKVDDDAILLKSSSSLNGDATITFQLFGAQTGSARKIQKIGQYTLIHPKTSVIKGGRLYLEDVPYADNTNLGTLDAWKEYQGDEAHGTKANGFETVPTSNYAWKSTSHELTISTSDPPLTATEDFATILLKRGSDLQFPRASKYVIEVDVKGFSTGETANSAEYFAGIIFRGRPGQQEYFAVGWHREAGANTYELALFQHDGTTRTSLKTTTDNNATDALFHRLRLHVNRRSIECWWDEERQWKYTLTRGVFDGDQHKHVGLVFARYRAASDWTGTHVPVFDNFAVYEAKRREREVKLYAWSGGNFYTFDRSGRNIVASSIAALSADVDTIESVEFFDQKVYSVDGTSYKVWNPASNATATWTATTGTLPASGSETCSIIAKYRRRIALSGLQPDPNQVYFGKAEDPDYWTTGTNPGDAFTAAFDEPVTALAPYYEDAMFVGCVNSIHRIDGDPSDGGTIKQISSVTGIVGQRAVALGPDKSIYFMGNDGLYRIAPNQFNVDQSNRITNNVIDKLFTNIDPSEHLVQLEWDTRWHGLHVFITPYDSNVTTHWFLEERFGGFWPIMLPPQHGPTSIWMMRESGPQKQLLMGGHDSQIRNFDPQARSDDGNPIVSHVVFGPYEFGHPNQEAKHRFSNFILDEKSDVVDVEMRVADTPQAAPFGRARWYRQVGPGMNGVVHAPARGYSICYVVGNAEIGRTWALEQIDGWFVPAGRRRDRVNRGQNGFHSPYSKALLELVNPDALDEGFDIPGGGGHDNPGGGGDPGDIPPPPPPPPSTPPDISGGPNRQPPRDNPNDNIPDISDQPQGPRRPRDNDPPNTPPDSSGGPRRSFPDISTEIGPSPLRFPFLDNPPRSLVIPTRIDDPKDSAFFEP